MSNPDNLRLEKIKLFDAIIAYHPEIERKGKTMPYTSLNGHMFTHLTKEGCVGIRLSKEDREAFLEKYNTQLIVSYGAVMKEYVHVPDELLTDLELMKSYLDKSLKYIKSLKPKPTTRKKK